MGGATHGQDKWFGFCNCIHATHKVAALTSTLMFRRIESEKMLVSLVFVLSSFGKKTAHDVLRRRQ